MWIERAYPAIPPLPVGFAVSEPPDRKDNENLPNFPILDPIILYGENTGDPPTVENSSGFWRLLLWILLTAPFWCIVYFIVRFT